MKSVQNVALEKQNTTYQHQNLTTVVKHSQESIIMLDFVFATSKTGHLVAIKKPINSNLYQETQWLNLRNVFEI